MQIKHLLRKLGAAIALSCCGLAQAQFYLLPGNTDVLSSVTNKGLGVGSDSESYFSYSLSAGKTLIGGAIAGNGVGGVPTVSWDGTRVGGTGINTSTGVREIGQLNLSTNTWTTYGGLGYAVEGMPGVFNSSAGFGMSGDGSTLVGNAWVAGSRANAVMVRNGVLTDLGSSIAGTSSRADSASYDGNLIGGYQDRETGYRSAAVWRNGVETLLEYEGNPLQQVRAVSGDGVWAVGGAGYAMNGQAYMWNSTTGQTSFLDNPFADDGWSMVATAVSADGSMVAGFAEDFWFDRRGWIYTPATGVVAMETFAEGLDGYSGEWLYAPTAFSPDGSYLVGGGVDAFGFNTVGWMIHTTAVPEPASALLLGAGMALVALRRRQQLRATR